MKYQEYLTRVSLSNSEQISISSADAKVAYEEVFKLRWMATKLKIFSFLAYAPKIDENIISKYSKECLDYALKNKKGLPRGWQNGIVSNNVLASETVTPEAIALVTSRPTKHYSAFEMPIIYDLSNEVLSFYRGEIIWGKVYEKFIRDYITDKFSFK